MLRQSADPHSNGAAFVEAVRKARSDNADEAGGQATLRRHQAARRLGQFDDEVCRRHVFGQIEVVDPCDVGGARKADVEVIGQAGKHGLNAQQQFTDDGGIGDVATPAFERQAFRRCLQVDA